MAQQVIKINGRTIHQPDTFKFSFATTSTEGTERLMSGVMCNEPMFTVESYAYEGSDISGNGKPFADDCKSKASAAILFFRVLRKMERSTVLCHTRKCRYRDIKRGRRKVQIP